jgi:sugar/nucleoside kinase (ribokinase family)
MDLWIQISRHELESLLKRIDLLVLNDGEAKLMMDTSNVVAAGHRLRGMGPKNVIIKKGEHGAMLFGESGFFACPAYPLQEVFDPTGAGDYDFADLTGAIARGSILASFTCESFSTHALQDLTMEAFEERLDTYRRYCRFE